MRHFLPSQYSHLLHLYLLFISSSLLLSLPVNIFVIIIHGIINAAGFIQNSKVVVK